MKKQILFASAILLSVVFTGKSQVFFDFEGIATTPDLIDEYGATLTPTVIADPVITANPYKDAVNSSDKAFKHEISKNLRWQGYKFQLKQPISLADVVSGEYDLKLKFKICEETVIAERGISLVFLFTSEDAPRKELISPTMTLPEKQWTELEYTLNAFTAAEWTAANTEIWGLAISPSRIGGANTPDPYICYIDDITWEKVAVANVNAVIPDDDDDIITLTPENFYFNGGLGTPQTGDIRNFGSWAASEAGAVPYKQATWYISVPENEEYAVSADYITNTSDGGGIFNLKIGTQTLDCTYPGTAANNVYEKNDLGKKISLQAGIYKVELTRTSALDSYNYVDLRSIILMPTGMYTGIEKTKKSDISVETKAGNILIHNLNVGDKITLFDIAGRLIVDKQAGNTTENIYFGNTSSIMILKINTQEGIKALKIYNK